VLAARWREGGDAYAVMRTATYAWLQTTALPMRFVAGDARRVIVSRYWQAQPSRARYAVTSSRS
jgi:hypothetical protein